MENKRGFTMSEVLITIGIIGIVAAITIPTLVKNYQKKVTAEKLKSAYALFQQVIRRSSAENGDVSTWKFPDTSATDADYANFVDTYLAPYLNISHKYKRYEYNGPYSLTKHGTGYFMSKNTFPYELSNGMLFAFFRGVYLYGIWVDINGAKKPNMAGKDVFLFTFHPKTFALEMEGDHCNRENLLSGTQAHCIDGDYVHYFYNTKCGYRDSGDQRYSGGPCGSIIERDGWKISDDYPW